MRSALFGTLALAAPQLAVAAGIQGFALGDKMNTGSAGANQYSCKTADDYQADFEAISSNTDATIVRGYAASDCDFASTILPVAKKNGFKVILGIWPDTEDSYNNDLAAIKAVYSEYKDTIYAVTCGSETLYRGNFTGETLLEKINDVKDALPGAKVGTADSWNKYADGTADALITGGADILLINAFAYWQGQPISNATKTYFDDMMQAIGHIQDVAGSIESAPEVWNGETGWPTDGGSDYGSAIAGTDNAKTFFQDGYCALVAWGVNAFYFEAFDEKWKPASVGDDGSAADETNWGAMTEDRSPKFNLRCSSS